MADRPPPARESSLKLLDSCAKIICIGWSYCHVVLTFRDAPLAIEIDGARVALGRHAVRRREATAYSAADRLPEVRARMLLASGKSLMVPLVNGRENDHPACPLVLQHRLGFEEYK
jgi:hypothetical protein